MLQETQSSTPCCWPAAPAEVRLAEGETLSEEEMDEAKRINEEWEALRPALPHVSCHDLSMDKSAFFA